MRKNVGRNILKYILELIVVAFGVFLGIYVSEMKNEEKLYNEKERSIELLRSEVKHNIAELERSIKYFEMIKTNFHTATDSLTTSDLDQYLFVNTKFSTRNIKNWNGLQVANFESTAFDATKVSGAIRQFDIELIRDISKVYTFQQTTIDNGNKVLDRLINVNSTTKVSDLYNIFYLITNDLLLSEKKLLKLLIELQTKLE